jgi:hypothetical protein
LRRSTTGVQWTSPTLDRRSPRRGSLRARIILGFALAGSAIGSLAVAPSVGAATALPTHAAITTAALTTTAIDRPWFTTEQFYFGLLNCDRTGGWIQTDGTCRGYGSGHFSAYVAPILYSYGLSDKVTRPYAKLLAVKALCAHDADGGPGDRLRRAGYTRWTWGENVGCRDGYSTAKAAILASALNFQSEKSANGGHWQNIKSRSYHWVGIGIWRYGSRTRLVVDFYG